MTDLDAQRQRALLEAQVERWTAEAKKLIEAGKDAAALDVYRRAADELPGAPWLQHRTAELSRKLKQNGVAISYFRRAATSFQIAGFPKRAVAPLRTAWSLAIEGLPQSSALVVDLGVELMQLHKRLGFAADASVTFERTNSALRGQGFSEIPVSVLESARSQPPPPPDARRVSSVPTPAQPLVAAAPAPAFGAAPAGEPRRNR